MLTRTTSFGIFTSCTNITTRLVQSQDEDVFQGGGIVDQKARELKNEYYREWRKKNKEKVRRSNEKYWEKQAALRAAEKEDKNAKDAHD